MRLGSPRFGGEVASGRARPALARLATLACVVGLVVAFALPSLAAGQDEEPDLPGVFTVAIFRGDVPRTLAGGPALIGQWILTLNDDGTYEVARQDVGVVAAGAYEVSGRTLTFTDWTGIVCGGGTDDDATGASYAWEVAGDQLTLTPIQETCGERRILFNTRAFGSYAACLTEPLRLPSGVPGGPAPGVTPAAGAPFDPNNPVGPAASPVPAENAAPAGAEVEAALDALLRQATACWVTQDPTRFLPLHGQAVIAGLLAPVPGQPTEAFLEQLQSLMATPVSFELIGDVTQTDAAQASAYVEITFDGAPIPQRLDFVQENGAWLFAFPFFLPPGQAPTPAP